MPSRLSRSVPVFLSRLHGVTSPQRHARSTAIKVTHSWLSETGSQGRGRPSALLLLLMMVVMQQVLRFGLRLSLRGFWRTAKA